MTDAIEGTTATEARRETRSRSPTGGAPTAQVIALPDLPAEDHHGVPILRDWNPLHQIKAKLQVCVGEATLSVGELLAAKENQVLCLDRAVDQAVDLTIEGKVVARGQLVAVDDRFAVRITELPVALKLPSSV